MKTLARIGLLLARARVARGGLRRQRESAPDDASPRASYTRAATRQCPTLRLPPSAGSGSPTASAPTSTARAGCPTRSPSQIGGQWNNINVVSPDRSYLESFIWQDTDTPGLSGELHVILRGYPGRTTIPTCLGGLNLTTPRPCFAEPERSRHRERDPRDALHGQPGRRRLAHRCCSGTTRAASTPSPSTSRRRSTTARWSPTSSVELASLVLIAPSALDVSPTRREVLAGAAAGALGAAGVYELVDRLAGRRRRRGPPSRRRAARAAPARGRPGRRRRTGVEVLVPPLHHEVLTAQRRRSTARELRGRPGDARAASSPGSTPTTRPRPAGLGVTVAWGLPYFRAPRPGRGAAATCRSTGAPASRRCSTRAASRATRTRPCSRRTTSRSCCAATQRAHIDDALGRIEHDRAPAGSRACAAASRAARFDGGESLPRADGDRRRRARRRADPRGRPSSSSASPRPRRRPSGPGKIANFETLGYVDLRGSDYFREGTHMHLSHVAEDLEAWYVNFALRRAGLDRVPARASTSPRARRRRAGPRAGLETAADVRRTFRATGRDRPQRLDPDDLAPRGGRRRRRRHALPARGTAVPIRADFNTLDNPFALLRRARRDPARGRWRASTSSSSTPRATTSSATGSRWTACSPAATLPLAARARAAQGFNSILTTTHRQNFLVPPRRHRSFPLAEL